MPAITVPPLGESIVEATISRWTKHEGDAVAAGETLVELETDKITVEVPAASAGRLGKRVKQEGDVVNVGDVLGELVAGATPVGHPERSEGSASPSHPERSEGSAFAVPAADIKSSPAARKIAAESGLDLAAIAGTGRGGVVSKPDVVQALAAPSRPERSEGPASPAPSRPERSEGPASPAARPPAFAMAPAAAAAGTRETREKMTTRRKRIAENLLQSQHATAHLTTFNEIDMSAVSALRERLKERVEKEHGVKLSFMPFLAKAAVLALRAFPTVNAQIDGDTIVYKHYVNLGIAVASEQGLVVPNLKDAHAKGMIDISREIVAVAKRARDGKLTMDDLTGGTFTITNGGVFGSLVSTPIINYPQVGILGLHKTQDRPIALNGQVVIRPMMYVALSYDHRIIDGQQAVLFLVKLKELMEDPATMLVD